MKAATFYVRVTAGRTQLQLNTSPVSEMGQREHFTAWLWRVGGAGSRERGARRRMSAYAGDRATRSW